MSDEQSRVRSALTDLSDSYPTDAPAVIARALALGPAARRRRTTRTVLAASLAVLVVVGGGAVALGDGGRAHRVASSPISPDSGTQLVGRGRAAVEVPSTWEVSGKCPGRGPGYVFVLPGLGADCTPGPFIPTDMPSPPSVQVSSLVQIDARRAEALHATQTISGASVKETDVTCDGDVCEQTVVVASQDAKFSFDGTRAQVDGLRASLRLLPTGYVAVPSTSTAVTTTGVSRILDTAGLLLPVGTIVRANPGDTSPAAGSVVPVGTVVTLAHSVETPIDSAAQLVGSWRPFKLGNHQVRAERRGPLLTFTPSDLMAYDGCDLNEVSYSVASSGAFRLGHLGSFQTCLGTASAVKSLNLLQRTAGLVTRRVGTALVLLGSHGQELATYRRVGPRLTGSLYRGTQLVGRGRAAVAVPVSWRVGGDCPGGPAGYVFVIPGPAASCPPMIRRPGDTPSPPSVEIDPRRHVGGAFRAAPAISGAAVSETEVSCRKDACRQTVVVPSEDAEFVFRGTRDDVKKLRDSLRLVPTDYTAVPSTAAARTTAGVRRILEASGLKLPAGAIVRANPGDTSPPAGTVVSVGTVLTVPDGRSPGGRESPVASVTQLVGAWQADTVARRRVGAAGLRSLLTFTRHDLMASNGCNPDEVSYVVTSSGGFHLGRVGAISQCLRILPAVQTLTQLERTAGLLTRDDGTTLVLLGSHGQELATYRRAQPAPGPVISPKQIAGRWEVLSISGVRPAPEVAGEGEVDFSGTGTLTATTGFACPVDVGAFTVGTQTPRFTAQFYEGLGTCAPDTGPGADYVDLVRRTELLTLTSNGRLVLTDSSGEELAVLGRIGRG